MIYQLINPPLTIGTLSQFRTALTKVGIVEQLFKALNEQLESQQIIVKKVC